ncbi:MAG: hypothetical protein ACI35S_03910 [Anaeroplasma sp.]
MPYDLEYHKMLDRSHILPNLMNGAIAGIASQFISDFIISLLLFNEEIIIEDIQISEIEAYYAAVASSIVASVLSIYMDPFAVVLLSTTTYAFVLDFLTTKIKNTESTLKASEIIFDTGVAIILIYAFDRNAHSQYLRYQQKRHFIEPTIPRRDRSSFESIFFIVLVSTYSFLKIDQSATNQQA